MKLPAGLSFTGILVVLVLSACGGGGDATTVTETEAPASSGGGEASSVDPSTCPDEAKSRKLTEQILKTGEEGVEEGKEVKAAESLVREAEKSLAESKKACRVEANIQKQEAKICRNTPQELAEAFKLEETKANAEYIGVYEATCGKRVPTP